MTEEIAKGSASLFFFHLIVFVNAAESERCC